ncbi:MAG: hypothetical protein QM602_05325 [Microbacterium sp.]
MTDVLIRNVPEEDLMRIDAKAERLGLSRTEYLRQKIAEDAAYRPARGDSGPPTVESFQRLAELTSDLRDEDVVRKMWS